MEGDEHVFHFRLGHDPDMGIDVWKHSVNRHGTLKRYIVHPSSPFLPDSPHTYYKCVECGKISQHADRKYTSIWVTLVKIASAGDPDTVSDPGPEVSTDRLHRRRKNAEGFRKLRRDDHAA